MSWSSQPDKLLHLLSFRFSSAISDFPFEVERFPEPIGCSWGSMKRTHPCYNFGYSLVIRRMYVYYYCNVTLSKDGANAFNRITDR